MEGTVCEQLKRNTESHAFDGRLKILLIHRSYHDRNYFLICPGYRVQWEEESTTVSCLHTLNESSLEYEYHCTDLSWNSTGSVVGVAYGKFDHHDWCSHKVIYERS